MQELEHALHYPYEYCLGGLCGLSARLYAGLCELYIPVAVYIPDEVIYFLTCYTKLKCVKINAYLARKGIELADDSLVLVAQISGKTAVLKIIGKIHHNES